MADPTIANLSYSMDDLTWGRGTNLFVESLDYGTAQIQANDTPLPRADGLRFGRDYFSGRTLTWKINALTDPTYGLALDAVQRMAGAWRGDRWRNDPGALTCVRMVRGDRARRVFGRPRRFASESVYAQLGWAPITCDFQAVDDVFYSDTEYSNTVGLGGTDSAGGFKFPTTFPMSSLAESQREAEVLIQGDAPTWLTFLIRGPIVKPVIRLTGEWQLTADITLLAGQTLLIDSRPWSRCIKLNGVTNVAGCLTVDSPRLSDLRLSPGLHEATIQGTDATATASLSTVWRTAHASYA